MSSIQHLKEQWGSRTALQPGMEELTKARDVAELACSERQPMPCGGVGPRLIAEQCEQIGEIHAAAHEWLKCANAHRMACWYWRKTVDD